jgi:hypothetical protein
MEVTQNISQQSSGVLHWARRAPVTRPRILSHAEETGRVGRTFRYFGIGRASCECWKAVFERHGDAGLVRKKPIPKNPRN